MELDHTDRLLINKLQEGIPLIDRPFAQLAAEIGLDEAVVISRVQRLLEEGVLSRFGPMFNAERMGGGLTLAAMHVPEAVYEDVAAKVNAFPEVAHNYAREHKLNMWFVVATEKPAGVKETCERIEESTGLRVYSFPKLAEYYLNLRFEA